MQQVGLRALIKINTAVRSLCSFGFNQDQTGKNRCILMCKKQNNMFGNFTLLIKTQLFTSNNVRSEINRNQKNITQDFIVMQSMFVALHMICAKPGFSLQLRSALSFLSVLTGES